MKKNKPFGELFYRSLKKTLKIMRNALILLFIGVLQAHAIDTYSQKTMLSLNFSDTELTKVLDKIEAESEFFFLYNEKLLDTERKVSITAKDQLIDVILDNLFAGTNVKYTIIDRKIILAPDYLTKETETATIMQQKVVSGTITDAATRELMPGVNVLLKGTTIGAITDINGSYTLEVPNALAILQFSFIGYVTQEIPLGGQSTLNVALISDVAQLSEVVVIGYGTVKKSDLTGSVASVKIDELKSTPITSIDMGLGGRVSGVFVTQTSGMPGAIASIRIRGSSSLQGGNEPLYVIDGIPVYNATGFGNTGGNITMSGLSTINPNDIERIEILKDASATSIYGARGANGVVLITTKTGQKGKDIITFNAYFGTQSVEKKIDLMDATSYAKLVNEAYTNDGLAAPYSSDVIANIHNNGLGTDWQDEIFRTAPIQNYQLTFSGGDQKSTYSISGDYFDQKGIIINSDFKRYSGRANFTRQINSKFNIVSNLSFSTIISNTVQTSSGQGTGVVNGALYFNPIMTVYDDEGNYNLVNEPGKIIPNPVATAEIKRKNNASRFIGNFSGEYEILEGLKAKVLFGIDHFLQKSGQYTPSYVYQAAGIAVASISDGLSTNLLNENTLTYSKTFNEDHSLTLLGGVTFQKNWDESVSASSQGFVTNSLQENNLAGGAIYNMPTSGAPEWGIMSFLGRANYNFKNRYLFTATGRYDGSSRFGENNKFGFFPSFALAWRVNQEEFIQNLNVFSNLKLRASYGVTGNQEIGLYNSLATLGTTNYTFGSTIVTGFAPNIIPNPDLKWERTGQYDFGLDMGFFDDRLMITADLYQKNTKDLIYDIAIPYASGFGTSIQNIGSVQNNGLDLLIESRNINKGFQWTSSFNISFNRSKVVSLGGEQYKDVGNILLVTGLVHRLLLDKPIGLFYGYVFDGIFQNQDELDAGPIAVNSRVGSRRYKDLSGPNGIPDGVIDGTYDRQIIGDPNPDFTGGFVNTFSYKGWGMNIFMQYSYGGDILNWTNYESMLPSGGQNVYAELKDRWTLQNPSNEFPAATTNRADLLTDQYIEDGSYLKLKTITLSYMFSNLKVKWFSSLRVYVTTQNLMTFTNYHGFDPEVSYYGASTLTIGEDYGVYPQSKSVLFGIQFDLR